MTNKEKVEKYLKGDYEKNTFGYVPELYNSTHKEGEEWTDDNGNKWVLKNGVRTPVTNEEGIIHREICIDCGKDIRFSDTYRLDIKTWRPTGRCYDCFYKYETKLKEEGKWEDYNKKRNLENERSYIKDCLKKFEEALNWCKEKKDKPLEFINSDGSKETWEDKASIDALEKEITSDIENYKKRLDAVIKEIKKLNEKNKEN